MFAALAGWVYRVLSYRSLWPKDTPVEQGSTMTYREQAGNLSLLLFSLLLSSLSLACGFTTVQCHHLHCGTQLLVDICGGISQVVESQLGKSAVQGITLHLSGDVRVLWKREEYTGIWVSLGQKVNLADAAASSHLQKDPSTSCSFLLAWRILLHSDDCS